MYRRILAVAVLVTLSLYSPSHAVTSKDKMATCKFGADDQHLQGKARSAFMKKCMSNMDEPRGASAAPPAQR
jgi:psiF repeat